MGTIYQQTIRPNGDCVGEDSTGGAPTIVGGAPQWGDQSDATYAVIPSRLSSGGSLSERSVVFAQMGPADIVWPQFTVTVRVRLQSSASLPHPEVYLRDPGAGGATVYQNTAGSGANPIGTPDWIELPCSPVGSGAAAFVSAMAAGSTQVMIRSPFAFGAGPDGTYTTTVYEVELLVDKLVASSMAPPCRNIKRGDVLDLGGARNYPPSKMQQTSSRGVGAY